jgi:rhodanese-related sulfurtransferase
VLTGDTLFVGDVGRPDLRAALGWSAADLGALLYDSLRTRLMALPDEVLVYPAHGAGSLCGKALSKETVSTIGEQRRVNYALQPMSKDAFVSLVTADQPDAPPYFTYDAVLNSKERPTLTQALEAGLRPLTIDDVVAVQKSGGQVLDTRAPEDFDAAHLIGSINVGLRGQYATWAGTVLDREHPIAIIADPGFEQESAVRLGRIGFDHIAGYLAGGLASLAASTRAAGVAADLKVRPTYGEGAAGVAADLKVRPTYDELVTSTERISAERAAAWMGTGEPVLLDVRTPAEHAAGHIDGSVNIPLSQLAARVGELPQERPILLYCAGGYRSAIAASLLQRHGRARVSEIAGGFAAWEARRAAINLPSAND